MLWLPERLCIPGKTVHLQSETTKWSSDQDWRVLQVKDIHIRSFSEDKCDLIID